MVVRFLSLSILCICLLAVLPAADKKCEVIAYLPSYRMAEVNPQRLTAVTELIYFGIKVPAKEEFKAPTLKTEVLKKLHTIKNMTDCKLLICVGGWDRSQGFAAISGDDERRQQFIAELLSFCKKYKFNGVDYDWEHPKNDQEIMDYRLLIDDTKKAFDQDRLQVTLAQAAWQDLGRALYSRIDRVHLMSYDQTFPQATLKKSKANLKQLLEWGCPPEKIALGLPFYGRNKKGDARTYKELLTKAAADSADSTADIIDGFAYNAKATITAKVDLAMRFKLAGVMIWEIGQDAADEKNSLLNTIDAQIKKNTDGEK